METQSVLVKPREENQFDVIAAAQHMDSVQITVANALGLDLNRINISVFNIIELFFEL